MRSYGEASVDRNNVISLDGEELQAHFCEHIFGITIKLPNQLAY